MISVAFSSDGRLCATGSMDATVRVWTVATGALVHVLEGPGAEIEVRAHFGLGPAFPHAPRTCTIHCHLFVS